MDLFVALIHFPSQTERSHVGPHFFNISQAFGLGTGLPVAVQPRGNFLSEGQIEYCSS